MRDFIDEILAFIGAASLTDEEFDDLSEDLEQAYSLELYLALRTLLQERESVSLMLERLQSFFTAKGISTVEDQAVQVAASEVLIGGVLD